MLANNPAMCAYVEAQKMMGGGQDEENNPRSWTSVDYAACKDVLMVSLGTGRSDGNLNEDGVEDKRYSFHEVRGWGIFGWGPKLMEVSMDGVSDAVENQLEQLLPSFKDLGQDYSDMQLYYRFQADLTESTKDMDKANPIAIGELLRIGNELVDKLTKEGQLQSLADKLTPL